jgi:diguanylate cyclase (GGDEF)-like protein
MNYAFLPDLSALAILIIILLVLRRRHPQKQADIWLLGLFLTLVEAVAHTFYAPVGMPNKYLHVIVVDCYLLAGLVFTLASGNRATAGRVRLLYVGWNGVALLAINTLYGLHYRSSWPYYAAVVVGLVVGLVTSVSLRGSWLRAGLHLVGWLTMGLLVKSGNYREVVYWSLSCVYCVAAFNFQQRLPAKSTGKLAIVTGFSIWALCFLVHPWVVHYVAFADIASHVWNMQKSLISIGMILVMLEEQVSSNQWLALHDELTGLSNRRSFEDRLSCAMDRARRRDSRMALLILDLNGFKWINDTLGHQAGDQVLREISKNLSKHVRSFDTLARLGGDEFTMIASDAPDKEALEHLLEEVRAAVERPLSIEGQCLVVTASMGISVYPDDARDASKLLWVADQRMYLLKHRPASQGRMRNEHRPVGMSADVASLVGSESSRRRRLSAALAEDASS